MPDCGFGRIARKEKKEHIVYEDADIMAFFSDRQITKGHTLVILKRHFVNVFDVEPAALQKAAIVAQRIAQQMRIVLGVESINLINASGASAGQTTFHFHVHVIPRADKNELGLAPHQIVEMNEKELTELVAKL